jgi:rhamnose utilization protein RhaD (predicted bifunctional aldolase and dehydrogenase)
VRRPPELDDLLRFSAQIGRDLLLTQANAGNTSIKINGMLWIKASGKWLVNAAREDIFLPLDLSKAKSCVRQQRAVDGVVKNLSGEDLKPSVETAMHAVLPQRVVVHLHSVNTIAYAIRSDAPECLESKLRGLRWQWVPYVGSGVPLAQEIKRWLRRSPEFDILILGNHGLVVCGDDCRSVEQLLEQVELRLGSIPRRAPQFDRDFLLHLVNGSNWRLPEHTRLHSLATDEASTNILANGSLYPCQLMILGGPDAWRPFYSGLFYEASRNHGPSGRHFLIVKDKGVLLSDDITRIELDTLIGLAEIVQRIDATAPIRYLTKPECAEITCSDAHRSCGQEDSISMWSQDAGEPVELELQR